MSNDAAAIVEILREKNKLEVCTLSDDNSPCVVHEYISTGCLVLDAIMGGGLPVKRMTEIYGDPSSGKSLIAAQIAAVCQEEGMIVAYADTETAVSRDMMKKVGVIEDELIYISPDTIEEVFEFFDKIMAAKQDVSPDKPLVLIWDSIAATSSMQEMSKKYGEVGYLDHARIISQGLRKLNISNNNVAALFLNQVRTKLGVMFGDDTATFGGKAVSFHASIRIHLKLSRKIKSSKKKAGIVGMDTVATVVKNKCSIPFLDATLPIYFGHGIDDAKATLEWLRKNEFVTGSNWKTLNIDGKELAKFQSNTWNDVYDEHYDTISQLIYDELHGDYDEGDDDG